MKAGNGSRKLRQAATKPADHHLIISDLHSFHIDRRAFGAVLGVIAENQFSTIWMNGDVLDLPTLSRWAPVIRQLHGPEWFEDHDFLYEVMFTRSEILAPLRKAAGKKTRIIYRCQSNHEIRYLEPKKDSPALGEIREVEIKLGARAGSLHDVLDLGKYDIELDNNVQTVIKGKFLLTHGERTTKNAPQQNFREYMMSGSSGHSHRMGVYNETAKGSGDRMIWVESGHLRTQGMKVEYMKKPPDWQQGYVDLWFENGGDSFDVQPHHINGGATVYNRVRYTA